MTSHPRISIPALRESAERGVYVIGKDKLLALVEAVALANEFIEREEPLGAEGLRDALARFDFGDSND